MGAAVVFLVSKSTDVAKIGACKVLEQTFAGSRGDSHEQHMRWDAVFARVE